VTIEQALLACAPDARRRALLLAGFTLLLAGCLDREADRAAWCCNYAEALGVLQQRLRGPHLHHGRAG
jgi:hypothetical protein